MRLTRHLYFMFGFFLLVSVSPSLAAPQAEGRPPVLSIESVGDLTLEELPLLKEELLVTLNSDEQHWYKTFHEGLLFFSGWNDITRRVVSQFSAEEQTKKLAEMQLLGIKIGYEWSKDNSARKVDNDTLRQWGKDLRRAAREDVAQLAEVLSRIESEINLIIKSSS